MRNIFFILNKEFDSDEYTFQLNQSLLILKRSMRSESFQMMKRDQFQVIAIANRDHCKECPICLEVLPIQQFYSVGCSHLFCKQCLTKNIKQQMDNFQVISCCEFMCNHIIDYSERSFYHVLDFKTKQKIDLILSNHKRLTVMKSCHKCKNGVLVENISQQKVILICNQCSARHCYNCFKPEHSSKSYCNSQLQIELPQDCQQCRKCSTIIQKQIGCMHMTCVCGYQFCFSCGFHWDPSHICHHRLPQRHGVSKFICILVKIVLFIPIFVGLLIFLLIVILSICFVSALLGSVMVWIQVMTKYTTNQFKNHKIGVSQNVDISLREQSSQFYKCCCFLMGIVLFPLFLIIFGIVGFFMPLINICYDKIHFMSPTIIKEIIQETERWVHVYQLI